MTKTPVNKPPKGDRTPLASFTADLEKLAEVGIELKNPPTMEDMPKAIISCKLNKITILKSLVDFNFEH